MLSPKLLVAVIKYSTYSFVCAGQKFSLTIYAKGNFEKQYYSSCPNTIVKLTRYKAFIPFFNLYHKAVWECCRSDVKTNVLIKTEAKCIFYKHLYKGNEDFSTQKGFV